MAKVTSEGISLARPAPVAAAAAVATTTATTTGAGAGQQHVALLRWLSRLFCINVIIVAAGSAGCRYLKLIDS